MCLTLSLLTGALLLFAPLVTVAQPTVDGTTTDGEYFDLGSVSSSQISAFDGEGLVQLRAYRGSGSLYVAVEGTIPIDNNGNFRDIMVWVNVDGSPSGIAQGDPLPSGSEGLSPFCCVDGMIMEMETDFGFRITGSGDGSGDAFVSFVDYTNLNSSGEAQDNFEAAITTGGMPAEGGATGGTYAYLDESDLSTADGNDSGWEFSVPLSEINASPGDGFQFFVAYGNPDGESTFSAHIIPDDGSSMEYNPDQDWTTVSNTQATSSDPLPVELASFKARRDGRDAVLNWSTASETNNTGFAIQHAAGNDSFEKIGWVDGAGTTTQSQSYQFSADDLSPGTHRFRLRQVDLDGSASLSDVVSVEIRPDGPVAVSFLGKNPVTSQTPITITPSKSSPVSVALYDVVGRRVQTLHQGRLAANQSAKVAVDASSLGAGTYFLRIEGETFTETKRISVAE